MAKTKTITLADLSHADKILVSFYKVSNGTTERIPFENIVLQAWRDFPDDFSLPDHSEHPDSYVISKRIYSDLITNRFVVSLKNKTYRLSEKGLFEAQRILGLASKSRQDQKNVGIKLNRDEKQFLDSALRSKTFDVWKKGNTQDLIDYDARVFFQFSTGTPIKERKRRVETAEEALKKAILLNMPESDELNKLFVFLVQRFPQLFQEK